MIQAIQTVYKGYRFRSRLETRYAVFFDALNIKWEYEKEGYPLPDLGYYLPDFFLTDYKIWVEIKGQAPTEPELDKIFALFEITGFDSFIFNGLPEKGKQIDTHAKVSDVTKYFISKQIQVDTDDALIKFFLSPVKYSEGPNIHCPVCGEDYVHIGKPTSSWDNPKFGNGHSGPSVIIPMNCEFGCSWDLRFEHHKGQMWFGFENVLKSFNDDIGLFFSQGNQELFDLALNKARSARFEFGETYK